MNFHCNKLIHSVSNSAKPIFLTISTKSYFYHSEVFPFPCCIRWSLFPYILRGSFSKSKIHPCLTVVPFWQLLHLRVFILMGIPVFVPLRSALNAGPLDLQRPHALVFDITDVFWLPLKSGRSNNGTNGRDSHLYLCWHHNVMNDSVGREEYGENK